MKKKNLTRNILLSLLFGAIFGMLLSPFNSNEFVSTYIIDGVLYALGTVFMNLLKFLVVPLVLVSIVCGVTALDDVRKLGRIGLKTVGFYLTTTMIAITIAILIALVIDPGSSVQLDTLATTDVKITEPTSAFDTLVSIVPTNPFSSLVEGDMLQVIFIAVVIGLGIISMQDRAKTIKKFFVEADEMLMILVDYVMLFAPIGIFALIAQTFANLGASVITGLIGYFVTVLLALVIHYVCVYLFALKSIGKLSVRTFIKKFLPVMTLAFSTSSSSATLSKTISVTEKELGVHNEIASFSLPLGATINMDGTAIMQGVAVVFLANVYGVDLSAAQYATVVLVATIASIGTAGVPGVGLVMLSMVLESVGIPVEGIALIIGIDRLLDMSRTVVNVSGDAICSILIAKTEDAFDETVYYQD